MLKRTIVLTASLLVLTGVSSCAVGGGGEQSPQAAPSEENVDPALAVKDPKDLKSVQDACQLLTSEQRTTLKIEGAPAPRDSEFKEPACEFDGSAFTTALDINTNAGGMTAAHERKDNFDNFEPTEVAGHPAVKVNFSDNLCNLAVGVSDTQSLHVYYALISGDSPEMEDTCGYASKIAAEAIKNIPPA
ncbi:DUF3558 domain-containing protein [Saccharopolyspora gregorii]|uniref:DUF3558 domain-containing protein n=1 Tax=Saccharopolyspora gregorii TaxID=33914 RepID=A0ABP6RYI2_9PSEU